MKLSILNLVPIRQGSHYQEAVLQMKRLAQKAEQEGYERYWIAEHHNTTTFASSATQLLIQEALSATEHIRVGSGGVMLPNHSPYLVAEQYGTLDSLYPNRLDLGLGRAPGTDRETARALRRSPIDNTHQFDEDIRELRSYFEGTASVHAYPAEGREVPFYVLGSSTDSAFLAAKLGLPYAFAAHFAPNMMEEAISIYRLRFQPSKYCQRPYVILGANVIMADNPDLAAHLATSQVQLFVDIVTDKQMGLRPPVEDEETVWRQLMAIKGVPHFGPVAFSGGSFIHQERKLVERMSGLSLIGDKETITKQLLDLKRTVPIDELMAVTYIYDEQAQHRSVELLAEVIKENRL
ncbi:LLM class flavin-dependent oxidoreductase [Streptococcus sp. zg-JUN1979]|uniref:LLM class flavin-dependent oxidoreductase n=1 Tax=Streptococcus sp. zg-JUN1979 TaxID=3391450 RepID=UPI0039A4CB77